MLEELKEFLDLDGVNTASFLELKNTDLTTFLKGETEEEKIQAYSDFVSKFVVIVTLNASELEKQLDNKIGLLKDFNQNEVIVVTGLLWNMAFFVDNNDKKLFKSFIDWVIEVLKKNLEVDETEDITTKVNSLTMPEVCSAFYYMKPDLQNEFILRLYQILGESYLREMEAEEGDE